MLAIFLLGLLATQSPLADSRSIPRRVQCLELDYPGPCFNQSILPGLRVPLVPAVVDIDLHKRAGGRTKPKPKGEVGNGESSGSGGGTNEGQRAGTMGNIDESQAKTGESSGSQGGGRVSGATSDSQGGGMTSGSQEGPPSKRNNDNKPAQTSEEMDTKGLMLDEETLRNNFREKIHLRGLDKAENYFFYSGIWPIQAVEYLRPLYAMRLKDSEARLREPTQEGVEYAEEHLPAMNDIREDPEFMKIKTDIDVGKADYYWAANSKAYAQIAKGNAILAIRLERDINQPGSDERATFWWTWEIAELTRNLNIDSIKIIPIDRKWVGGTDERPDPQAIGKPMTIWSKGDPPLSFPADLQHEMARPKESLSYTEVFDGNTVAKAPPEWAQVETDFGPQ
jgi:hypothetical protein